MWCNEKTTERERWDATARRGERWTDCARQKASAAICLIVTFKVLSREGFLSFISLSLSRRRASPLSHNVFTVTQGRGKPVECKSGNQRRCDSDGEEAADNAALFWGCGWGCSPFRAPEGASDWAQFCLWLPSLELSASWKLLLSAPKRW